MRSTNSEQKLDHPIHVEKLVNDKELKFPSLAHLTYKTHLVGGSGGVHLFEDAITKEKFVLKRSTSAEHLKYEIFASTVYARLGFKVPSFAVFKTIPASMHDACHFEPRENELFLLAKFIKGETPREAAHVPATFAKGFITDAFLKNRDLVGNLSNLIVAGDDVYRVDNGSILNYRALGAEEDAADHIERVIDVVTLRDEKISPTGFQIYGALTEVEIKQQKEKLLEQSTLIIDIFKELHAKLNFAASRNFYDLLVSRLNSLANDDFDSAHEFKLSERAAGVMTYCEIKQSKTFVLLGQRNGTHSGTWCTLGGKSELYDKTLQDTAAREVKEESNGLIVYSRDDLQFVPFVEQKLSGAVSSYRMYIASHDYVDASQITDNEYLQFAWVSLENLIASVESKQDEFEPETYPSGKLQIKLYPDMYQLLSQPHALLKLKAVVTKSKSTLPLPSKDVLQQFTEHFSRQIKVMREFKSKQSEIKTPAETKGFSCKPLSLIHLELVVGSEGTLEEKVQRFIELAFKNNSEELRSIFLKIIQEEQEFLERNYYSFYHAAPHFIGVAYDLITAFYKELEYVDKDEYIRFRLNELPFRSLPTLSQFMEYFLKIRGNRINNYDENYQEMAISVNPFLFGNHKSGSSDTCLLFQLDMAAREIKPFAEAGIFDCILDTMGFAPLERTQFLQQLEQLAASIQKTGGRLYKIRVHGDHVDKLLYPCVSLGDLFAENDSKKTMSEVLQLAAKSSLSAEQYFELQARFFMNPEMVTDLSIVQTSCVNRRSLSPEEAAIYQQKIGSLANQMICRMVSRSRSSLVVIRDTEKPFVKDHGILAESILGFGKVILGDVLGQILRENNVNRLIAFLRSSKHVSAALLKQHVELLQLFKYPVEQEALFTLIKSFSPECDEFITPNLMQAIKEAKSHGNMSMHTFANSIFRSLSKKQQHKLLHEFLNHFEDFLDCDSGVFYRTLDFLNILEREVKIEAILKLKNVPLSGFFDLCYQLPEDKQRVFFQRHISSFMKLESAIVIYSSGLSHVKLLADEKMDLGQIKIGVVEDFFSIVLRCGSPDRNGDIDELTQLKKSLDVFYSPENKDQVPPELLFRALINLLDRDYLRMMFCDRAKLDEGFEMMPSSCHAALRNAIGEDFIASLEAITLNNMALH